MTVPTTGEQQSLINGRVVSGRVTVGNVAMSTEDWVLDDPAGQDLDHVRPIRDKIRGRIETLIAELVPARPQR